MAKKIILSFDDARSDFYSRALPIMKRYNIPSTLNVITSCMRDIPQHEKIECCDYSEGLTCQELIDCYHSGLVEIACHGAHHLNTKADVEKNIIDLQNIGVDEPIWGFASPNSELTENNKSQNGIWDLVKSGTLLYVRSGIQIRREGYIYAAFSLIDRFIHSKLLFRYLNRHNIIYQVNERVLPSVAVYSHTSLRQIKYLVENLEDSTTVILMFHSILQKGDNGYGNDKYFWDADSFNSLCSFLKTQDNLEICMTKDLFINK